MLIKISLGYRQYGNIIESTLTVAYMFSPEIYVMKS